MSPPPKPNVQGPGAPLVQTPDIDARIRDVKREIEITQQKLNTLNATLNDLLKVKNSQASSVSAVTTTVRRSSSPHISFPLVQANTIVSNLSHQLVSPNGVPQTGQRAMSPPPRLNTLNSVQSNATHNMITKEKFLQPESAAFRTQDEEEMVIYQSNLHSAVVNSFGQKVPSTQTTPKKSALKKPPLPTSKTVANQDMADSSYFTALTTAGLNMDVNGALPFEHQGAEAFLLFGYLEDKKTNVGLIYSPAGNKVEILFEHSHSILHAVLTKNPTNPSGSRNCFIVDSRGAVVLYSNNARSGKYEACKTFSNVAKTHYFALDWAESTGRILSLTDIYVFYPAVNSPPTENWLIRIDSHNLVESVLAFKGPQGPVAVQQICFRDATLYVLATDSLLKYKFDNNTSKIIGQGRFEAICTAFEVFSDHRVAVCSQVNFAKVGNREPVAAGSFSLDILNSKLEVVYRYTQDVRQPYYEFVHLVRCVPIRPSTHMIDNFALVIMCSVRTPEYPDQKPASLSMVLPVNPRTFKRTRSFSELRDCMSLIGAQGLRYYNNSLLIYGNGNLFRRIPL